MEQKLDFEFLNEIKINNKLCFIWRSADHPIAEFAITTYKSTKGVKYLATKKKDSNLFQVRTEFGGFCEPFEEYVFFLADGMLLAAEAEQVESYDLNQQVVIDPFMNNFSWHVARYSVHPVKHPDPDIQFVLLDRMYESVKYPWQQKQGPWLLRKQENNIYKAEHARLNGLDRFYDTRFVYVPEINQVFPFYPKPDPESLY